MDVESQDAVEVLSTAPTDSVGDFRRNTFKSADPMSGRGIFSQADPNDGWTCCNCGVANAGWTEICPFCGHSACRYCGE